MTKLTDKKIKWLVREVVIQGKLPSEICNIQGVSKRRVEQLAKAYRETKRYPVLMKNRRPKTFLSEDDKKHIDKAWDWHRVCAPLLKNVLDYEHRGNKIAVNKIHSYLKECERAKSDPKKQKRRKRCRYERKHSFSLLHSDWTDYNDIKVLAFEDDASRFILSGGEYSEATEDHVIECMKKAEKKADELNAFIGAVNTDRGTQYYANKHYTRGKKKGMKGQSQFEKYLLQQGIIHIPSRYKNPQTNGKQERWFQEYTKHRYRFNSFDEFASWYNNRIHGALKREWAETPQRALIRKLRPECLLGLFFKNVVIDNEKSF